MRLIRRQKLCKTGVNEEEAYVMELFLISWFPALILLLSLASEASWAVGTDGDVQLWPGVEAGNWTLDAPGTGMTFMKVVKYSIE